MGKHWKKQYLLYGRRSTRRQARRSPREQFPDLMKEETSTGKTQLTTDRNGQIVVTDLPLGSYQFTEEKAPDGFVKLSQPVAFKITRAGQTAVVNGVYVQASGNVQVLSVVNQPEEVTPTPEITNTPAPEPTATPVPDTPSDNTPPSSGTTNVKTGDNTPILPMIAVLVLAVIVAAVVVILKKKKHDK